MLVEDFDYELPEEAIAQEAIEPRDASRLLITSTLDEIVFRDLAGLLRPGDVVVVNNTKVRAARLHGVRRGTGGRVEVLLTRRVDPERWQALLRPARRLRAGTRIDVGDLSVEVLADPTEGVATVAITPVEDVEEMIATYGQLPLPPYFVGTLEDPGRYQTMFAQTVGSAAAPTAALHFTPEVVQSLEDKDVRIVEVELEVGLDTFRPMGGSEVEDHTIHTERIRVSADAAGAINDAKRSGSRIVAVGTTVVRTLESVAGEDGTVKPYEGQTNLFITPGYAPRVVDAIITNFHAPRTTLLVLIAAFLGDRWRDAYDHAVREGFRFLSFGDAMYIEVDG